MIAGHVCKILVSDAGTSNGDGRGRGTGYLVSETRILTAYHVVKAATQIEVVFFGKDDGTTCEPTPVWFSEDADIAVLECSPTRNIPFLCAPQFLRTDSRKTYQWQSKGYSNSRRDRKSQIHDFGGPHFPAVATTTRTVRISCHSGPESDDEARSWGGVSGAAVFDTSGESLLGVVIEFLADESQPTLVAVPLPYLFQQDGFADAIRFCPPSSMSIDLLPDRVAHFVGREDELRLLDELWVSPDTCLVEIIAFGGAGKTALVAEWLDRLSDSNEDGPDSIFSVNSRNRHQFLDETLREFGTNPTGLSEREKGQKLARLVNRRRSLVILDEFEQLLGSQQYIEHDGMRAFLLHLAKANAGLCIVLSRHPVSDFEVQLGRTVRRIDLGRISAPNGAILLRRLGVKGRDNKIEDAVDLVDGHGLALSLLGTFLKRACAGEVSRIDEVKLIKSGKRGNAARHMLRQYEQLLDCNELSIVRLLGLFTQQVDKEEFEFLTGGEPIPGLTNELSQLTIHEFSFILSDLRDYRLISPQQHEGQDYPLSCHALTREYFAEQMRKTYPESYRQAHIRLAEYAMCKHTELGEMSKPVRFLCQALKHFCAAEEYHDGFQTVLVKEVFSKRTPRWLYEHSSEAAELLSACSELFTNHTNQKQTLHLTAEADKAKFLIWYSHCMAATHGFLSGSRGQNLREFFETASQCAKQSKLWKEYVYGLTGLLHCDHFRGDMKMAKVTVEKLVEFGEPALKSNGNSDNADLRNTVFHACAETDLYRGKFSECIRQTEKFFSCASEQPEAGQASSMSVEPSVAFPAMRAWSEFYTGGISAARKFCDRAVQANVANLTGPTTGMKHYYAASLYFEMGDSAKVRSHAQQLAELGRNSAFWNSLSLWLTAAALKLEEEFDVAEGVLRNAIEEWGSTAERGLSRLNCVLAELLLELDRFDEAREINGKAQKQTENGEEFYLVEIHRVDARIFAAQNQPMEAEREFELAFRVAETQDALSFELRVANQYCEWCRSQGESTKGRNRLRDIFHRFDSCDSDATADLRKAKLLIQT